ncbi:conserved hypothetical protein [Candidatus Desulfosporosinus infrequens]|uniref:HNH endonuclease n=1 Tax=Candidatus Desulfosporosinus infrequens TaxID=2043169 RepID=A0A2U3LH65_9FIRM|nr:conserved hypothetical protein [Candidatus Desulfosporosinus infrequens]
MELWKDIEGFEGVYQISTKGRLKSFKKLREGFILSNKNSKKDYLSVVLTHKGRVRYARIHKLVAEAFIANVNNKPQINHKDGNKQNNKVENLEWVSGSENVIHAISIHPNMLKGMNKYNKFIRPNAIQQYNLNGELLAEYPNAQEAFRLTGVCGRNILQVASETEYKPGLTRKQAGGFIWRFKERKGKVQCTSRLSVRHQGQMAMF